jgi:hypothetical protein
VEGTNSSSNTGKGPIDIACRGSEGKGRGGEEEVYLHP